MSFSERLRDHLKTRRISQAELGEAVGVSQNLVSRWTRGANKPDVDQVAAIAECLGVSLDELILGRAAETTPDERMVLRVHRALGLTSDQAIRGLSWAAENAVAGAGVVESRAVAVRDETAHQIRLDAERRRRESNPAGKPPGR